MAGFDKQQKEELKKIMEGSLQVFFDDMVKPAFELIHDKMHEIELRLDKLEDRMTKLDEKVEDLKSEVMFARRELKDLGRNSVETVSFRNLQARVTAIEFKLGV